MMITLKNVKLLSGAVADRNVECAETQTIDCEGRLILLPAIIDVFGMLDGKISREAAAQQYLKAGISCIFDGTAYPPRQITQHRQEITALLDKHKLPLNVNYFLDGNLPDQFDGIGKAKSSVIGIKITLDLAQKPIGPPHIDALDRLFQIAAQENMIVTIALIQGKGSVEEQRETDYITVERTIALAEKYSAELCLQHIRTKQSMDKIKSAKANGLLIHVEVGYPHLILTSDEFPKGALLNGATLFLPNKEDQEALWEGIHDRSVDMIGSTGIFTSPYLFLPLLMEAFSKRHITLDRLVELTHVNPESIFRLPQNKDVILVDPSATKTITGDMLRDNETLSAWKGKTLVGLPRYVITQNTVYSE